MLKLRGVQLVAQGKARSCYLCQSLSDSTVQALTYIAPAVIPLAQLFAPKAWSGTVHNTLRCKTGQSGSTQFLYLVSHSSLDWE